LKNDPAVEKKTIKGRRKVEKVEKRVDIILKNIYSLSSLNIFSCLSSLKSKIIARIISKNETLLFF